MTRRKVEMKPIEDKSKRLVTFSKRRKGLMKKCRELSVLCDLDVAVIVFSNRGKRYEFSTPNSLTEMIRRYQDHLKNPEVPGSADKAKEGHSGNKTPLSYAELLQNVERHIEPQAVEELTVIELDNLEKQLNVALMEIKSRKTELLMETIDSIHEQQQLLSEENKKLEIEIVKVEKSPPQKTLLLLH